MVVREESRNAEHYDHRKSEWRAIAGYGQKEGGDPHTAHEAKIGQHQDKHVVGPIWGPSYGIRTTEAVSEEWRVKEQINASFSQIKTVSVIGGEIQTGARVVIEIGEERGYVTPDAGGTSEDQRNR